MPCQWSPVVVFCSPVLWVTWSRLCLPGILLQVLQIWKIVFYPQVCFTLHSFLLFQGFHGASSSISKSGELHATVWNTVLVKVFELCNELYLNITNIFWILTFGEEPNLKVNQQPPKVFIKIVASIKTSKLFSQKETPKLFPQKRHQNCFLQKYIKIAPLKETSKLISKEIIKKVSHNLSS